MNKIKKEFLGKHVLGAPESVMRVLSMWLLQKSRKVVSVTTSMKDECVSLPKSKSQLAKLHDEDVFATNIIDRYAARQYALHNICLATFAVTYDLIQSSKKPAEINNINTQEDMHKTENADTLTKMEISKRIRCHQEEKTAGNTMYKKIQNTYRTRKILPCKASPILPMERRR